MAQYTASSFCDTSQRVTGVARSLLLLLLLQVMRCDMQASLSPFRKPHAQSTWISSSTIVTSVHRTRQQPCQHVHGCRRMIVRMSQPQQDVNALYRDKSAHDQMSGEVATSVAELVDTDRTAELLIWLWSSIFNKDTKVCTLT